MREERQKMRNRETRDDGRSGGDEERETRDEGRRARDEERETIYLGINTRNEETKKTKEERKARDDTNERRTF